MENCDMKTLLGQLSNYCVKFKKSKQEICEIYSKVSGEIEHIRNYLMNDFTLKGGKKLITWSPLEDMALTEPDTSVEFQVLLQEKGW